MRCCQNKTIFAWSYRDSSKRSLENNVISRRGKRKIHTLEIGGYVQMAKSDPKAQRKSSLSDCTWLENEYGSFNLEALKFLMHFREPGSSFYFIFTHTHTHTHTHIFLIHFFFPSLSFFLFLSFSFLSFFFLIIFFICSLLNSKLHCTYLLLHA
jgi:hypothetical protein